STGMESFKFSCFISNMQEYHPSIQTSFARNFVDSVYKQLALSGKVQKSSLEYETAFTDLGADSLDILELIMDAEELSGADLNVDPTKSKKKLKQRLIAFGKLGDVISAVEEAKAGSSSE
ncbi:MAG: hypothetical protein ABIG30_01995, partial [Candidatus Aenigmatarchaeota archaeon]